jgi:hypothetical protein
MYTGLLPPALLTADASAGPTAPPVGAWIMGTSIPTRVQRVVFMQRTPKSASMMNNRMPPFNHCRVGESERVATFGVVPPLVSLRVISLRRSNSVRKSGLKLGFFALQNWPKTFCYRQGFNF